MGEIRDAMDRLEARKQAVHDGHLEQAQVISREQLLATYSGLDLDPKEIEELYPLIGMTVADSVSAGISPMAIATAMFWEGLAAGLILAETRAAKAAI